MPLFDREARAAREAERSRMFTEDAERARINFKRDRVARLGYEANTGRVGDHGGYGVTIHDDGTVSIGDRELGDYLETRLAGLHATLETLASARDRVTATRLVALGVLALAVPKRDRRMVLTLHGPDGFEAAQVVDGTNEPHLRQWVAWLNRQGAQAAARDEA